jgi:hypothetical protein
MKSSSAKMLRYLFPLLLSIFLFSCAPAKQAANPNLTWTVSVLKYEVKNKLEGVETVTQYNGSYDEFHQQAPADGNVYLIMNLTINKSGAGTNAFDWSKLTVKDEAGKTYQRTSNDTFLEQFKYKPRMTGLEIKIGSHTGWACFEIPAQAANGKLTLTYTADGSQQEVTVK